MDLKSIKYYNQNAARLAPEYHSTEVTGLHTLLGRWLPIGGEVLEIGCGAGRDAAFMASIVCKVVATDASESMLTYSHEYLEKVGESNAVSLLQTAFPLPTGHSLLSDRFDVDHIIPFSLWHNNDLWNLVPSDQQVNNKKRDKIITRETLYQCEDRIIHYWRIQNDTYPETFQTEVSRTLLGTRIPRNNWEKPTISALGEAVELVAIQRGVERWEYQ